MVASLYEWNFLEEHDKQCPINQLTILYHSFTNKRKHLSISFEKAQRILNVIV